MALFNFIELDILFFLPLGFVGAYRWLFWMLKVACYLLYKPIRPVAKPKYTASENVTVVVPTIDCGPEILIALESWMKSNPKQVIFVTIPEMQASLKLLTRKIDPIGKTVKVITVPKGNKRNQMVAGINQVETAITIFCDDDVQWPDNFINHCIAPFEDDDMGGVGTSQRAIAQGKWFSIWEIMASFRVSMRNVEITASTFIDGGVVCLSGRTAAYRTSIIKNTDFQYEFTNEFWAGKYHLNSGDDKFLTRWMQNNGWKTHIQASPETMIKSTFKNNWRFILQLLRWTRNSWRSDIKALLFERTIWKRYPYTAFTMLDRFFNPITVFFGPVSVGYIIYKTQVGNYGFPIWVYLVSYLTYLFASRFVKYTPHFVLRPFDILYLPVLLLFNFAFPVLKLYCLCTLSVTNWGTRKGADATKDQEELEYVGQKYVSTSISRKPTIKLDLEAAMNRRNSSMMTDSIVAFPIIAGSEVSYQGSNSVSEIRDSDQSSIVSDIEGSVRESGRHV